MVEKISLSSETPSFEEVAEFRSDTEKSIKYYYTIAGRGMLDQKFVGYSLEELNNERDEHLFTLDQTCAFAVLAALEASFRTDFYLRCSRKMKDDLSRHFRSLYNKKGKNISFEEDIIDGWKHYFPETKSALSQLKGAFNYRHWFAHGRYYKPKLGQKYDFFSVYNLAELINRKLLLES
jgi:hypothetical protein